MFPPDNEKTTEKLQVVGGSEQLYANCVLILTGDARIIHNPPTNFGWSFSRLVDGIQRVLTPHQENPS